MRYRVVENCILRAVLSHFDKECNYIHPNDAKSVLNYLRGCLERISCKIGVEGCAPPLVKAKHSLQDSIREIEKYEYKRIKRKTSKTR